MNIERLAAFTDGNHGGNPAGVLICDGLPEPGIMQSVAMEVGYSETAFATPIDGTWRVRYFAPATEVPFCGHATIALGAVLAVRHGDGTFHLRLNDARITVQGFRTGSNVAAALNSPPTSSRAASFDLVQDALTLFGYVSADLDQRMPPAILHAGADHLLLALNHRERLAAMRYHQEAGRLLMQQAGVATVSLVHAETAGLFHARNPFAAGGVYEDPATGAAAAALAGYLRALNWPHGGVVRIVQGEDMGMRSLIQVEIPPTPSSGIRVSGTVRWIERQSAAM